MRKLFAVFRYFFIFFLLSGSCEVLNAQFEIEGTVTTTQGQSLPGADVWLKSTEFQKGCITDSTGHFSIEVPGGKYLITFRYLGYTRYTDSLNISHTIKLNVTLFEETIKGKEVTILGKQPDNNIKSTETGVTKLEQRDIKKLPRIIGETDAIKALQYTPGVTLTGEGNSGIYVRGGAADQNLILIDDAVVYNPAHLLGIFSVFNTDILHNVELYKGGIPAGFGGRISSVIDIQTKDGNFEKVEGNASVGFISSKAYVSGPVIKEKISAFVSARKCYLNALLGPVSKILFNNASNLVFNGLGYNFFDINAGVNARLSKKSKIQFRIYNGGDYLNLNRSDLNLQNDLQWTNLAL